ncbi:MAG: alkaline phosphatase D [Akkermansiaceae bacterium]|jgi:alkaline phosphatase D
MMALVDRNTVGETAADSMDQWPGYAAERQKLLEHIRDHKVSNAVVLTSDIHSNWANELRIDDRIDDRKDDLPTLATEFVATSLTSGGNGSSKTYAADFKVISDIKKPGGVTTSRAKFVVEAGKAIIHPA